MVITRPGWLCASYVILFWSVLVMVSQGCQSFPQPTLSLDSVEQAPLEIDDGWAVTTPTSQAVNAKLLLQLYEQVENGDFPEIDGIVVIRNGYLVSERYYGGYDLADKHETRSTFKSVTGLITGIAIDNGLVDINEPVAPLLARYHELSDRDPRKQQVTIQDFLTMRSGLDCSEMPGRTPYRENGAKWKWDWVGYNWEIPMAHDPGAQWHYCSSNPFLLGVALTSALERQLGIDVRDFAHSYLFEPLQITGYKVNGTPDGHMTTQGNGYFRPRDLAKFGQLVLDEGSWQGRQLVSSRWIKQMTDAQATTDWSWTRKLVGYSGNDQNSEYGFQWFRTYLSHRDHDYLVIHSWGNGGQFIFVVPELHLVTVVTGSNYGFDRIEQQRQAFIMLANFVLPAVSY